MLSTERRAKLIAWVREESRKPARNRAYKYTAIVRLLADDDCAFSLTRETPEVTRDSVGTVPWRSIFSKNSTAVRDMTGGTLVVEMLNFDHDYRVDTPICLHNQDTEATRHLCRCLHATNFHDIQEDVSFQPVDHQRVPRAPYGAGGLKETVL